MDFAARQAIAKLVRLTRMAQDGLEWTRKGVDSMGVKMMTGGKLGGLEGMRHWHGLCLGDWHGYCMGQPGDNSIKPRNH